MYSTESKIWAAKMKRKTPAGIAHGSSSPSHLHEIQFFFFFLTWSPKSPSILNLLFLLPSAILTLLSNFISIFSHKNHIKKKNQPTIINILDLKIYFQIQVLLMLADTRNREEINECNFPKLWTAQLTIVNHLPSKDPIFGQNRANSLEPG